MDWNFSNVLVYLDKLDWISDDDDDEEYKPFNILCG